MSRRQGSIFCRCRPQARPWTGRQSRLYLYQRDQHGRAHVAALAALIVSQNPAYGIEQVRQLVRESADDVGAPGFDIYAGYGRINALLALQTLQATNVLTFPKAGQVLSNQVTISGSANNRNSQAINWPSGAGDSPHSLACPLVPALDAGEQRRPGLLDTSSLALGLTP